MALIASNMLPLGATAPDFNLPDTRNDTMVSLQSIQSDIATVVVFACNHCPFVLHIQKKLVALANTYQEKGIAFAVISSNDIEEYPDDAPDKMRAHAEQYQFSFPYLYDESQSVAKAYQAACTPDFYVFDQALKCVYRGRFDASTPGKETPVTGEDLSAALDAVLANEPVNPEQKPSMGCNIKWKEG